MRSLLLVLAIVMFAGCGGTDDDRRGSAGDLHPPRNSDERIAASRFKEFVAGLEQQDEPRLCAHMAAKLADDYGCGSNELRVPREVRDLEVGDDLLVAVDPVPDDLQVSVSTKGGGSRLVAIFSEHPRGAWRIIDVLLGSYG